MEELRMMVGMRCHVGAERAFRPSCNAQQRITTAVLSTPRPKSTVSKSLISRFSQNTI